MPVKELRVNLRQYDWWTVEELAVALEISQDEASKRIDDLLALEVISGNGSGYRFNEIRREMRVTVTKESGIAVLLHWFDQWRWNRILMKDARQRAQAAARYQEKLRGVPFMGGRFSSRY